MRVLITGITGFVGPHLAELSIQRGDTVLGLVRASNGRENDIRDVLPDSIFKEIRFIYADLLDYESCVRALRAIEVDGIYHLAAQSHPPTSFADPRGTAATNLMGTINLAEAVAAAASNCRLMFCSTSEVYGAPDPAQGPINEAFPLSPVNPYGVSKAAADMYVRERAASAGRDFFVTRAFSHTGPRRGTKFSIASDASQIVRILKGYQEPVIKVGTLSSVRAVMDVRDLCDAYHKLMAAATPGEAYNVGADRTFSMGELLEKMLQISGLAGRVEQRVDPALVRPVDIPAQACDSTKCRSLTQWKPVIPIERTLSDLLYYYETKIG